MSDEHDPRLLNSKTIAAMLGVHPKQIYRLLKQGLPGHRVGGEWRFRRDDVLAWSAARSGRSATSAAMSHEPTPVVEEGFGRALLAANGEITVRALLSVLNREGRDGLWGFVQSDRDRAEAWLASGRVDAAGSHGSTPPARIGGGRIRVARIHLAEREVGLAARAGTRVPALGSLGRVRVASRPETAGVFTHLRNALAQGGIDAGRTLRKAVAYDSHQEVIEALLRDEADVGLTTHAMAARAGLPFRALATESYGLLVRSESMGAPAIVRLCEAAQSTGFRALLNALPGCDSTRAGDIRYDADPA